jgi:hypothetical protein
MQSMFLWEELPANPTQLQDSERDWTILVVTSCLPMWRLLGDTGPHGWSGRTSPASFQATRDETLEAFWDCSLDSTLNVPRQDGKTAESYRATRGLTALHGECLTLSLPEYHSAAVASSLSDILVTTDVPQRYFLSVTACKGILCRAVKRGKLLPEQLRKALLAVVQAVAPKVQRVTTFLPVGIDEECNATIDGFGPLLRGGQGGTRQAVAYAPSSFGQCQEGIGTLRKEGGDLGGGSEGLIVGATTYPINTQIATRCEAMGEGTGLGIGANGDPAYTLQAAHSHAVAFQPQATVSQGIQISDICPTLDKSKVPGIIGMQVRRLMPVECARLQGFPDDHCRIPSRFYKQRKITKNRPADMWEPTEGGWHLMAADGPIYKAFGNSMAIPPMRWIGERITMVDKL